MKKSISKILLLVVAIALIATQTLSVSAATYVTDGNGFYTPLDHNGDGKIDLLDLVRFKKMIASGSTTPAQDYNGTGTVDAEDMIYNIYSVLGIDESAWTEAF